MATRLIAILNIEKKAFEIKLKLSSERAIFVFGTLFTPQRWPFFSPPRLCVNFVELNTDTVEALVSDHLGNSEKWSQLELIAYKNGLS